jgi:hypothetical protein
VPARAKVAKAMKEEDEEDEYEEEDLPKEVRAI